VVGGWWVIGIIGPWAHWALGVGPILFSFRIHLGIIWDSFFMITYITIFIKTPKMILNGS